MLGATVKIGFLLSAASGSQAAVAASRNMPSPLWRGVSRIALSCPDLAPDLCGIVYEAALARSVLPVMRDDGRVPTMADRDLVVLAVAIERKGDRRALVATVRRGVEIDEAEAPIRHAVTWNAATSAEARVTIAELLRRILPGTRGSANNVARRHHDHREK